MTSASDKFSPSTVKILFGLAVSTDQLETVSAAFKFGVTAAIQPPYLMLVLNYSVFIVYLFGDQCRVCDIFDLIIFSIFKMVQFFKSF